VGLAREADRYHGLAPEVRAAVAEAGECRETVAEVDRDDSSDGTWMVSAVGRDENTIKLVSSDPG
jgi:hypothetical protein